jgi:hypothetical protein
MKSQLAMPASESTKQGKQPPKEAVGTSADRPIPTELAAPGGSLARFAFAQMRVLPPEQRSSAILFPYSDLRLPIQRKVTIGAANDPLELEADAIAERVMSMSEPAGPTQASSAGTIQRKCACEGSDAECAACKEKRETILQRKPMNVITALEMPVPAREIASAGDAPSVVHQALHLSGKPLERSIRRLFEPRFGYDFSQVRVHTDKKAGESAAALGAKAYTTGSDVVFGAGYYEPNSHNGQRLIAHELAHVCQQRRGRAPAVQRAPNEQPLFWWHMRGAAVLEAKKALNRYHQQERDAGREGFGKDWRPLTENDLVDDQTSSALGVFERQRHLRHQDSRLWQETLDALSEITAAPATGAESTTAGTPPAVSQQALREDIEKVSSEDVRAQWASRRDSFIKVASDPDNKLKALQMYQIWLHFWIDEQAVDVANFQVVEKKTRDSMDPVVYVDKRMDFDKGKRNALGAEFEAAADRKDAAAFLFSCVREVHDWLENYVDEMHKRVTMRQVNEKALEIARAKQMFQEIFAPVILGAIALGSSGSQGGRPSGPPKPDKPPGGPSEVEKPPGEVEKPPDTPPKVTSPQAEAPAVAKRYNFGGEGEKPGFIDVNAMIGNRLTEVQIRARNPTGGFIQADMAEFLEKADSDSASEIWAGQIPSQALGKNPSSIAANMKRVLVPGGTAKFNVSSGVGPAVTKSFEEAGFVCQSHGCSFTKK